MKIAVCYSGFLRNIHQTYTNTISKIGNKHEVDFFIHTWNVDEYVDEINYADEVIQPKLMLCETQKSFERNPYHFINSYTTPEEYKTKLENSGEDKKFFPVPSEENNFNFNKEKEVVKFGYYSSFPYNFLSQFYSIHQAIGLKKIYEQKNGFVYDLVIRIRPDVFLQEKIDLLNLNSDILNVFDAPFHGGTRLTVNDHFAAASSGLMDIYSECFLFLPTYYFVYKIDFIQEIVLGKHLEVNKIPINKMNTGYVIMRDGIDKEAYPKFIR